MDRLAEIFGKENVLKDEPMSRHTTFRIGGAADFFVKVQTISQSLLKNGFMLQGRRIHTLFKKRADSILYCRKRKQSFSA